jgi:hypothetical protein
LRWWPFSNNIAAHFRSEQKMRTVHSLALVILGMTTSYGFKTLPIPKVEGDFQVRILRPI